MLFENRPYQLALIEDVRMEMRRSRRVLMQAPTGAGKTHIFSNIAERVYSRRRRVYAVAHRVEIIKQISAAFSEHGIRHGAILSGRPETTWPVQVGMVQTIVNRLDRLPPPDLLIVDEAHHAVSDTYQQMFRAWPNVHVLMVTATPQRLDGRGLSEIADVLVLGPKVRWLIDKKYLADFRLIGPPKQADLSGLKVQAGDYVAQQIAAVMDKAVVTGDAEAHYRTYFNGAPCVGFCATVAHAEHVAEAYRAKGWKAAAVNGNTHPDERDRMLAAIGSGDLNFLASCSLIDEGTDLPEIRGVQLLSSTQSLQRYLQRVGRGLRVKRDGGPAIILDHVGDCSERHGRPDFPHKWTLEGKKRNANVVAPGVWKCPGCYLDNSVRARVCDECGTPAPVGVGRSIMPNVVDGTLVEMGVEAAGNWLRDGPIDKVMKGRKTFQEIDDVRIARGFLPGWTRVQMAIRVGYRGAERTIKYGVR